jgi:CHASE2 domain-containing sensor protein
VKKGQLIKEAFIASLLVIIIDLLLSFFPLKFELIRPIKQGFNDFDIYDLRYAGNTSSVDKKDTNITILGIGNSRNEIAQQINTVASFHPRVIAVDALFESRKPDGEVKNISDDSMLTAAIANAGKIIVATKYAGKNAAGQDSLVKSFFADSINNMKDGLYNFLEGGEEVNRHFFPFHNVNDVKYPAFASSIIQAVSPDHFDQLLKRNKDIEVINYAGNAAHFNVVSLEKYKQYKNTGELNDLFNNKIVLIGFIKDKEPYVLEDLHFSPMNGKFAGKSFPDMYGIVIHANIIEMVLSGNYISEMSAFSAYLFTFFLVFAINIFYIWRLSGKGKHNHFLLFIFQFLFAVLLTYFALMIFAQFNYRVNLTPIIIAVVLSFEIFWLYETVALKMHKIFGYETFLSNH